jgi:hypothetical protein
MDLSFVGLRVGMTIKMISDPVSSLVSVLETIKFIYSMVI